jgi:hypothetical protein
MKTRIFLIIILFVFTASAALYAETVRVITKENTIRQDCRFFSPVSAKVKYGDSMDVTSKEVDWYRVRFNEIDGCIHKSAVEEKVFKLTDLMSSSQKTASADEVALAGKGFNPQVEESFKKKRPDLDFRVVDKIETYGAKEGDLRKFIENGGLNQP